MTTKKTKWLPSQSTVNLSQLCLTQRSTHHIIIGCDELIIWRVTGSQDDSSLDWADFYKMLILVAEQVCNTGFLVFCTQSCVHLSLSKVSFLWLTRIHLPLKQHFNWFSCICIAHVCDQHTNYVVCEICSNRSRLCTTLHKKQRETVAK